MKKVCYFECFSGASGDMLLASLLDTGIDQEWFKNELKKIEDIKDAFNINISKTLKKGINSTDVNICLIHHEHHHRGLNDIISIIHSSSINKSAKELAIKIFTNLARSEAKVHNCDINKIHFHEVGAIDAIVDIVGFSILFVELEIDTVMVSPVNVGSGIVKCAHGIMPVPAPATLELISSSNWPVYTPVKIESELLTPTGAAILSTIHDKFGNFPNFTRIKSVSYGAGKKNLDEIANVIRLTIGEIDVKDQNSDCVVLLETNIDDLQPEFYDHIFDKLFQSGALDVFLTPIIMKKSRPANILSVICHEDISEKLQNIIFEETSTFGIRTTILNRTILSREFKTIKIEDLGEVRVKIGRNTKGKIVSIKPEYDDCVKLAVDVPLKIIYQKVFEQLKMNEISFNL